MPKLTPPRALVLTVGTGDMDALDATLLTPLKKSIAQGEWARVVLLPSKVTEAYAERLRAETANAPIEVVPLPKKGQEDNADACFAHFDSVIAGLRQAGLSETHIVVDFTRGTKAMSAALVLAAVRHDLPRLRYISSAERDRRGSVVPGTERIAEVATAVATGQKMLDAACQFFRAGNFAAALAVLPHPRGPFAALWPASVRDTADQVRPWAEFYEAWDRLDYQAAAHVRLAEPATPTAPWHRVQPTAGMLDWVRPLAEPLPDDCPGMAGRLRLLAADLLANGERRIRDAHYEDAVVRAYRVLELVGQARMFDLVLDSARLPADHPLVVKMMQKLAKDRSRDQFGQNRDGTRTAARQLVARTLKCGQDPLAMRLLRLGEHRLIKARNSSLLIHGFQSTGAQDRDALEGLYGELEALIAEDGGEDAASRLNAARALDLSDR